MTKHFEVAVRKLAVIALLTLVLEAIKFGYELHKDINDRKHSSDE